MDRDHALALIERQFTQDDLTPEESAELRAHLREDEVARARYDALAEAEEALSPEVAHRTAAARLWPHVAEAEAAAASPVVRRLPWRVVVPLAGAAAVLLLLLFPRSSPTGLDRVYGFEMTPGRSLVRGADAGPTEALPVLEADGDLVFVLRPETPQSDVPQAQAYRLAADGLEPLAVAWERSAQGSLRGRAKGGVVLPDLGVHTLVVVLGAKDGLPSPSALAPRTATTSSGRVEGDGWSAWVRRIERR